MYELLYLFSDTHALVQFLDEDSTAIVPISRLKEQEHLEHGGSCIITWSDKKQYKALLLLFRFVRILLIFVVKVYVVSLTT